MVHTSLRAPRPPSIARRRVNEICGPSASGSRRPRFLACSLVGMDACVVVPIYRSEPSDVERLSLSQLIDRLGQYEIIAICSDGFDLGPYDGWLKGRKSVAFDRRFFTSRQSYNALVLDPRFYDALRNHERILICQTDAYVFEDQFAYWLEQPYDFIGAPFWANFGLDKEKGFIGVGNGGFSLRRTAAFMEILRCSRLLRSRILHRREVRLLEQARRTGAPEDYFWGLEAHFLAPFRVPPVEEARYFSVETGLELIGDWYLDRVPFGCHGPRNLESIISLRAGNPAPTIYDSHIERMLTLSGNL